MNALPEDFELAMQRTLGQEVATFKEALAGPSPTSVRINPHKSFDAAFDGKVPWSKYGRYLHSRPSFTLDPFLHAGAYYVQEASSMFLEQAITNILPLDQPLKVLDLSAAPGGKSTHIVSLIHRESLLISNEVIRSRASILSENLKKWGYPNVIVTNNDPQDFAALEGQFDAIVVDAPCSGEGLFRKDPQAINEWSLKNITLCSARQKRIVADVWPALKEDGILIYCTCTYNRSENEDNLKWISQNHAVEFIDLKVPGEWNIERVIENDIIGYRFFPHRVQGEGFFLAALRKKEPAIPPATKSKKRLTPAPHKLADTLKDWIEFSNEHIFLQHEDLLFAFPERHMDIAEIIRQHVHIIHAGTALATQKHDKLIPDQALATSTILNRDKFPTAALDLEQAIQYLRREIFPLELKSKGYHLATYKDVGLGWMNSIGNRFNNLYPMEWRIRMSRS